MSLCRNVHIPTHVLYADDIMIFYKGSKKNLKCLINIFELYGAVSGQVINKQKSNIPFTYLGCPIFVGKPKVIHFRAIADRIKSSYHLLTARVSAYMADGEWNIPEFIVQRDASIRPLIAQIILPRHPLEDRLVWCPSIDGNLSAKQAFEFLYPAQQQELFASLDNNWSPYLLQVANAAIIHALHTIWLARCGIRFNNTKINMHAARTKILTATKLSAELITGLLLRKTDEAVLQNLSIDDKPAIVAGHDLLVFWRTPVIGWMKANTDGSVTNGSAACGGLFRDYMGNFYGVYAQKIEAVSVLHVELMALIFAMELANSKGWKYLWHAYANLRWWSSLPPTLRDVFLSDKLGHPQYRTV
ncbi:hypothetical protein P8452_75606 [Trifolium repens]|nr:hypothetical protein P8452_75606 [Trifolium repens]